GHFEIVDNPVYIPTSKRKPPSINDNYLKIDNNIRMVQGQIDKEKRYNADLVTIEGLRVTKQTDEAFGIYQKLTRNYGDLASRDELRELMLQISQAEKELVVPVELNITTSTEGKPSVIENTVVLATTSGQPVPGLKEEIVVFLADGAVYGIDAGDGSIVWRRFVGYETHNQPVQIDEETIAVSDQRDHQLLAVDKKTGELQWRTEINEPFLLPTLGEQVLVVTTESGRLLQLDTNSGAVGYSTQLPQPANVSALVATRDPYIYQVGSYQNLYVLSSQDYSCAEVHYLGHYEGSISIPPQAWTGFILVAVNGGDSCDLHVLKPQAKGLGLELVQVISNVVDGTVSVPLQRVGRWMLLTADNGEMKILELFPAEEQNPVRVLTADLFDAKGGQSVYVKAEGSNLWVAGQGIMRYRIQRNLGTIGREVLLEPTDTFISPIQKLDDYLMHVRRRNGSGMISVSLVDAKTLTGPETLKSVWRTDIGGALAGQPMKFGDNVVAVSNQGDTFSIDAVAETSRNAGIPVRGSAVIENLIFSNTVRTSDDTFAVVAPAGRKDFLTGSGSTGRTKLLAFGNPADKPACLPMAIGEHLIVPTQTGQIARVDPSNGRMIGTPFQPPIQAGSSKPQWFEPTMIGNDVFAIGAAATDDGLKSMIYLLDGSSPRVVAKIAELELENSLKSRLVIVGQNLFGVSAGGNADSLISLTAATALTLEGSVEMEGELVDGPWPTDAGILVRLDNDKLYCFGTDLAVKWSIDVSNEKFACSPTQVGAQLMVCFQNGKVNFIDPGTGQVGRIFDLGQPIIHEPLRSGNKMYFGGVDGTVHVVDLNKLP
ncbi:MAG: outer membrane protein assembly factor BamB, partial [Mariniblastus sp.]